MTDKNSDFYREKAEELQEILNREKERANALQRTLESERVKLSVRELVAVAESSARIVESMAGVNRQTDLAYRARMVAVDALRRVRERLEEGDSLVGAAPEG